MSKKILSVRIEEETIQLLKTVKAVTGIVYEHYVNDILREACIETLKNKGVSV